VARTSKENGLGSIVALSAWLLDPIVTAIRAHVFAADKIHGNVGFQYVR
jgi:hypothetical protein